MTLTGLLRSYINWQQFPAGNTSQVNSIPADLNVPFCTATDNIHGFPASYYFPADYAQLPTVAMVIPNLYHEMHSGRHQVKAGDNWLRTYMDGYVHWARTHNSLLILTWDEDGSRHQADNQRIATILVGAHLKPGSCGQAVNHYNLLRTLEDMYQLRYCTNADSKAAPITDVFTAVPKSPAPGPVRPSAGR